MRSKQDLRKGCGQVGGAAVPPRAATMGGRLPCPDCLDAHPEQMLRARQCSPTRTRALAYAAQPTTKQTTIVGDGKLTNRPAELPCAQQRRPRSPSIPFVPPGMSSALPVSPQDRAQLTPDPAIEFFPHATFFGESEV